MNPIRYWMKVTIASNPKKMPQTLKQAISVLVSNIIVMAMVTSFSLGSHILVVAFPVLAPIIILVTLALMIFMMISLFIRMRRVTAWRSYKIAGKDKPAE